MAGLPEWGDPHELVAAAPGLAVVRDLVAGQDPDRKYTFWQLAEGEYDRRLMVDAFPGALRLLDHFLDQLAGDLVSVADRSSPQVHLIFT